MGIRLDRYTAEMVKCFGTAQHELRMQELQLMSEFFIIEVDDDGHIVKMKAREFTLDLIDRVGYMKTLDFIESETSLAIHDAKIKFDTPVHVIPTDDKDDDDGFIIETAVVGKGLFKQTASTVEMEITVKAQPSSQGMRFLKAHYQKELLDELNGMSKKNREKTEDSNG